MCTVFYCLLLALTYQSNRFAFGERLTLFVSPFIINGVRFQLSALLDLKKKAIQGAFFVHD